MNEDVVEMCRLLRQREAATGAAAIKSLRRVRPWAFPGIYGVWVDAPGARDLTAGVEGVADDPITPGLVYVGQAGARPPGRVGYPVSTLGSRWADNHLGRSNGSSTVRRTLHGVLGSSPQPDELTAWMMAHLHVVAAPMPDRDRLYYMERQVIAVLDPPLNLPPGVEWTPLRRTIKARRPAH